MILQNTLYAFIETQGLTLVELPIFYRNPEFRRYVVGNIRYNWQVQDYWNLTFASKSRHDQEEIMETAQTRAETMLAHPYVSDIVGQAKTTIDFRTILSQKKVVRVKLSNRLSEERGRYKGTENMMVGEQDTASLISKRSLKRHRPVDSPKSPLGAWF